jgi:type IV pilus assembly protein PilO
MNELLERFLELPPRQRMLLVVGLVGVVILGYAYFLYWPRSAEIEARQKRLATLTAERDKKARLAANLPEARRAVEDLQAALRKAVAQLPDSKEIPDLLSGVSAVGRDAGLEIVQFRQRAEEFRDFYAEVPVEMLVRGTYFQVEQFFDAVSKLTRIVNVSNIVMKSPSMIPDDPIRLETACSAVTFRFLDEAERERIARERKAKEGRR